MKYLKLILLGVFLSFSNVYADDTHENISILKLQTHPDRGMGIQFNTDTQTAMWAWLDVQRFSGKEEVYNVWVSMMLTAYATKQNVDVTIRTTSVGYKAIVSFDVYN